MVRVTSNGHFDDHDGTSSSAQLALIWEHTTLHSRTDEVFALFSRLSCLRSFPRSNPLRARRVGRAGLRNNRLCRDTCRVCGRSGFWGNVFATARSFLESFFWWSRLLLTPSSSSRCPFVLLRTSSFRRRSWDCTANNVLHRAPIDYIEQHNMSTNVNGATGALSMGPSAGYILATFAIYFFNSVALCLVMSTFLATASSSLDVHISVVTIITSYLWIKFNMKIPKFLTI